jgi:cytochrome c-type biogenesis protein CcmH
LIEINHQVRSGSRTTSSQKTFGALRDDISSKVVKLIASILLAVFSCTSFAIDESQSNAARYTTFTKEVRCVVCQNQNLADSTAPLANDLREKIYNMILEKKSDEEIKDYLVKRYGEFILLRPRFNKLTIFLWLFPLLGLGFTSWYLFRAKN